MNYTVIEFAKLVGKTPWRIIKLCKKGNKYRKLKSVKDEKGRYLIPKSELKEFPFCNHGGGKKHPTFKFIAPLKAKID